ncbi:hypothetical protein [Endozoicomonas sp. ALD040]|uniref:hypothetical protein n=1 Tax=Endozoicomonas sp. ALD040 TaxID=3403079 RepID=UPI003BAE937B
MNTLSGINCFSCLRPQPNPHTQSVAASGQWTTTEPTKRLPPPSREDQRQALLEAAKSGRLAVRQIELAEEASYLDSNSTPRTFTLAQQGMPCSSRKAEQKWTVGIVDPNCLYVYKKNAASKWLEYGPAADKPDEKLLPDLQSLAEKSDETRERTWWDIYPPFTSGHLEPDGMFSLPKLNEYKYDASMPTSLYFYHPARSEIVVTHYGKADIKCFFVVSDTFKNISDILQDKKQCEQALKIEPLPMVVFDHHTGSAEVCFDDELDFEHLALVEHSLDIFKSFWNIRFNTLKSMMNLLPMRTQTEALRSGFTIPPDDQHKWQQAIELVSDPCSFSCQRLSALKESGLPIHRCFCHEGTVTSLLDMLLISELKRFNNEPREQSVPDQEDEALQVLKLLLKSGAIPTARGLSIIKTMGSNGQLFMPPALFDCMAAAFAPFRFLTLQNLWNIPLTSCWGGIVEFNRICKEYDHQQLQSCLREGLSRERLFQKPTLDTLESHLLALFHFGAVLDDKVLDRVKRDLAHCDDNMRVIDNLSVAGFIEWVQGLWWERNTHSLYRNWETHVTEAREQLAKLKQSLDLPNYRHASLKPMLQFLVDAFSKPPVLPDNVGDNEDTILKVLQHYYRRPGPERVIASLGYFFPDTWKHDSCSHALRARNNGLWYMELLEKYQAYSFTPQEKSLLPLAIIYQGAACEDVERSAEKTKSADYFKRDLTGHYPESLLNDMALAIVNMKNKAGDKAEQNLSESVSCYLHVLRFAVLMDKIRSKGVSPNFPGLTMAQRRIPDASDLDLPPHLATDSASEQDFKTEFQQHLEAAMHGAADLVQVQTKHPWKPTLDKRENPYIQVYGLVPDGKKITMQFDLTAEPVQRMNRFIDDNVRRKIAKQAGIITCSDPSHKTCKADQNKGITYGIHNSWYDLSQVRVPAAMTLLEKMQFEHDPSLLSPATLQAIEEEVQRLKSEGIRMNHGSLTRETLNSEEAQKVLKDRGIAVISEKRPHFSSDVGFTQEPEILVPKKIAKPD